MGTDGGDADDDGLYATARGHADVGRFGDALGCYERLLSSLGEHGRRPDLRARALLGAAHCVYETAGDRGAAMRLLDDAEAVCREAGLRSELVAVQGQRGLLWLRSGDVVRARAALDRAAPRMDDGPSRDAAVLLLNRGALHLDAGGLDAAERDLEGAAVHARMVDDASIVGKALHNLGYTHFLRGDLPAALRMMSDAAAAFADRTPQPVALLDRSRVLYEAGLVREAAEALEAAAPALEQDGAVVDLAHVRLDAARCLVQLGRHAEAARAAQAAREAFVAQSNGEWARRAELIELDALLRVSSVEHRGRVGRRAQTIAQEFSGLAPGLVTVPARLLAAEAAFAGGDLEGVHAALAAIEDDTSTPLSVQIQRHVIAARLAFAEGDRRRGLAIVRRGHRLLSSHRMQLGSVDAVTAAALHGARLAVADVDAALRTGLPRPVFDAAERGRATFAGSARVRPPADTEAAELLARARQELEAGLAETTLDGRERHMIEARRLQDRARRRAWLDGGSHAAPSPVTARAVSAALRSQPTPPVIVSLVKVGRELHAVVVTASGQRLLHLGDPTEVAEQARRVSADTAVLANPLIPPPLRAAAVLSVERSLARIDELLLGSVGTTDDLHVVARDFLLTLPWTALPSRRGRNTLVNTRVELRRARSARPPSSVLVVAGPGLRASDEEIALVAETWEDATVLRGGDATCAAVASRLSGARVVHLAAHGTHEPENPLFSSLRLGDGPLFAYDLDGIDLTGAVIVLAACDVGSSSARVGGEPLGLTSVLLRLGADAVIAAVAPLRDDVAHRVMPKLHAALREGVAPAAALAGTVAVEAEPVPLVCFGPLIIG